jgi:hypothetical protein
MYLEPVPSAPLAQRRAVVSARIDRIEIDLSRVTQGTFPAAVRALLADLEHELDEILDASLEEEEGERSLVIVGQHASLRRDLQSIAALFATHSFGVAEQRAAAVLLCDLCRELDRHLSCEEPVLAFAVEHAPQWARRADALRAEHVSLRESTWALARAAEAAANDAAAWAGIRSTFVALHERLLAHEHAESDVIQSAYLDDLGGGD